MKSRFWLVITKAVLITNQKPGKWKRHYFDGAIVDIVYIAVFVKYFDEIKQTTDLIGVYGKERQAKGSAVINKLLQYNNGFTSLNKNYIS